MRINLIITAFLAASLMASATLASDTVRFGRDVAADVPNHRNTSSAFRNSTSFNRNNREKSSEIERSASQIKKSAIHTTEREIKWLIRDEIREAFE